MLAQLFDQAVTYHQSGNLHQAELLYRHILRSEPCNADVLNLLGVIAHQVGRADLAVDYIHQALQIRPDFAGAHNNLANVRKDQGRLAEAIAGYRQALHHKPDYAEAYSNLGNALQTADQLDEAIACYRQALHHKPDYAVAASNLGNALQARDRFDEAVDCFHLALRIDPDYATAHINLAKVLIELGRNEEAIRHCREAIRLRPDFVDAFNNLACAQRDLGQLDAAIDSCRQALRLKPDHVPARVTLGTIQSDQGRHDEAAASFREATVVAPHHADAHFNLSMKLLLRGDFEEGWTKYEYRWQTRPMRSDAGHFSQPLWRGESLPHGTILLRSEQGRGDIIQFIRYAPLVKDRVGTVVLLCPPDLVRLLRSCAGVDRIIPYSEPGPVFDVQVPLMSLPAIFKTRVETIPADIPYLHAEADPTPSQSRALERNGELLVGLVWQGNPKTWNIHLKRSDRRRSIPLALFEPLARVPGVRLISLQKGFGIQQIQEVADRFPVVDLGRTCDDFFDTAVVMRRLDLVISVDSSPAHLAGALGMPVWLPLPMHCCWRWLTQREDSPWYPTMRLFRQTTADDWSDVVERMASAAAR